MAGLRRSYSFNPGSVYRHPERVHVLPPPEVTRLRTLPRPLPATKGKIKPVIIQRESSPIRKLPLPEIFYTNSELEEKSELTSSDELVRIWREENERRSSEDQESQSGQENSCSGSSTSSPEDIISSSQFQETEMVSRRAILHRSRDDMQTHLAVAPDNSAEQWFTRESLYKDHINEVLGKWSNIEDSIWAKVIVLERNRRIAKAYARTPVLTINGSQDGFDGYRIGLNGFNNPLRDAKVAQVKEEICGGCKLKMDEGGNILVKRVDSGGVFVKNTAEETAVSNDILKLPGGLLEKERAMKLFDMKKFQQNINREMKRQRPERNKLESQCISTLAFVSTEPGILECPVWVMIINIVALEMLGDKMPTQEVSSPPRAPTMGYGLGLTTLRPQTADSNVASKRPQNQQRAMNSLQRQTNRPFSNQQRLINNQQRSSSNQQRQMNPNQRPPINSSSDEDPYSLTQSGSSGYSFRDPYQHQAPDPDEFPEIFPATEPDNLYFSSTLGRPSRKDRKLNRDTREAEEYGGEDPYYSGYSARVTHLSNKIKQQRARSKDALSGERNSVSPWWHSRLYPDSGVELSSVGSGGSPAIKEKNIVPGRRQKRFEELTRDLGKQQNYLPGLLRNGGLALKTRELSSYQERRKDFSNIFSVPRNNLFKLHGWE